MESITKGERRFICDEQYPTILMKSNEGTLITVNITSLHIDERNPIMYDVIR